MYKYIFFLLLSIKVLAQNTPMVDAVRLDTTSINQALPTTTSSNTSSNSQSVLNAFRSDKPILSDKWHYGGNLWLGFFGSFYIQTAPKIGYEITKKGTVLGVGLNFIFQGGGNSGGTSSTAFGGCLFLRQPVYRSVFAQAEMELMNADKYRFYDTQTLANTLIPSGRKWGGSPLVGLGYYLAGRGQQKGSFMSVMYNLGSPNYGFIDPQRLGGGLVIRYGMFF